MVYPISRSQNKDLQEGMSDGKYKKVAPNRGGIVDPKIVELRRHLYDIWYGVHECEDKCLPDGTYDRGSGHPETREPQIGV